MFHRELIEDDGKRIVRSHPELLAMSRACALPKGEPFNGHPNAGGNAKREELDVERELRLGSERIK